MDKRYILPITFVIVLGLALFVTANSQQGTSDRITFEVNLQQGWNIVASGVFAQNQTILSDSEIKSSDIGAIFYYSPSQNKYLQIYPYPQTTNEQQEYNSIFEREEQLEENFQIESRAVWVYSNKAGTLKFETDDVLPLSQRQLRNGWNFVSMTSEFKMKKLSQFKGTCSINQIAIYNSNDWIILDANALLQGDYNDLPSNWEDLILSDSDSDVGYGILFKVSSDCKLATSGSSVNPPQLPGNSGAINTGLRKNIEDYYYQEYSYEECTLNNAKEYTSKSDCESAWRCIAIDYANLIPEGDLQDLADYMKAHGGEMGDGYYREKTPSITSQMSPIYTKCLTGKHQDY